jgi:cytochrome c553
MRTPLTALIAFHLFIPAQSLPAGNDNPARFSAQQIKFFENQVHPVLAQHCWSCHGEETQESDLRLDSRTAVLEGGALGPAAVPGDPRESLLIHAVRGDGDLQMPPDSSLSSEQITTLERWVSMGMPWTTGQVNSTETPSTMAQRIDHDREHHWAFAPLRKPAFPTSRNDAWCSAALDRFIAAKLEEARLTPSSIADRRTLIRRVSFDLLGLPPTPVDVERFELDARPDAYERLIDRLLASPQLGQRWGRHWLDVARYADTRGYAFARDRRYPFAYTYRDYVIDAFNADLPFDRFIIEQLAADRLELGDDRRPLAALGFLTVGRKFNNQHDDIDDKIDVVTRGLMGLTVACARCHDHKYDPIPTEDYYSLYGIFASCHEPDDLPLIGMVDDVAAYQEYIGELERREEEFAEFSAARHAEILDDGQTDLILLGKTDQTLKVVCRNINIFSVLRGSRIPWRDEYAFGTRTLCELPGKRMFAATAADHQNVHNLIPQSLATSTSLPRAECFAVKTIVILIARYRKRNSPANGTAFAFGAFRGRNWRLCAIKYANSSFACAGGVWNLCAPQASAHKKAPVQIVPRRRQAIPPEVTKSGARSFYDGTDEACSSVDCYINLFRRWLR